MIARARNTPPGDDTVSHEVPTRRWNECVRPNRKSADVAHIACYALGVLLEASQLMIKEYRSSDFRSFKRWWGKELRDKYTASVRMGVGNFEMVRREIYERKISIVDESQDVSIRAWKTMSRNDQQWYEVVLEGE